MCAAFSLCVSLFWFASVLDQYRYAYLFLILVAAIKFIKKNSYRELLMNSFLYENKNKPKRDSSAIWSCDTEKKKHNIFL